MARQISYAEASSKVRNKETYYATFLQNHWHAPSKSSCICTLNFMRSARKGLVYCPKLNEVNANKKCFNPPPKKILCNDKLIPALKSYVR